MIVYIKITDKKMAEQIVKKHGFNEKSKTIYWGNEAKTYIGVQKCQPK